MRRVAGEEHATLSGSVDDLHVRGPWVGREHRRVHRSAHGPVDERAPVPLPGLPIDVERDHPPRALTVDGPHQRGGGLVEDPVLHGGSMTNVFPQFRSAEDHAEVRPQRPLTRVRGADGPAHRAARAVTAEHVLGGDGRRAPRRVEHRHLRRPIALSDGADAQADGKGARRELLHDLAQELLQDVLGGLLTGLGKAVTLEGEPQHPAET